MTEFLKSRTDIPGTHNVQIVVGRAKCATIWRDSTTLWSLRVLLTVKLINESDKACISVRKGMKNHAFPDHF